MTSQPNSNTQTIVLNGQPAARPAQDALPLHVDVFDKASQLETLQSAWRDLQTSALVPAIGASPSWQLPLFQHANPQQDHASTIAVRNQAGDGLTAIAAFRHSRFRWLLPLSCLASWDNDFFFTGTPLITSTNPQGTLQAILSTARRRFGASAVLLLKVPADGPFASALQQACNTADLPMAEIDRFERAGLITGKDFESWFAENFKRKKRKEFRRQHTRLGEQGDLECVTFNADGNLAQWIDEFLALESAGWKGRRGTALACSEQMSAFLHTALPMLQANGELIFWKLALDGKPLAMLFAMVSGSQAWLGKIAYDEDFARFSPGVQLILDVTRDLLSRDGIELVDSSAIPDHPMINHIWRDRIAMTDMLIATPGTSRATFQFIKLAERARRYAHANAKKSYHHLLKGKAK